MRKQSGGSSGISDKTFDQKLKTRGISTYSALPGLKLLGLRLSSDNVAGLTEFENWLGRPADFLTGFAEMSNASGTWSDSLSAVRGQIFTLKPLNRPIHWGFPLCHGTSGNQAKETLRGDHDETIKQMFQEIIAANRPLPGNIFLIRLGWEMNFWSAYPWCRAFISPTQYKNLFRKIVGIGKSIDSRFYFEWTPNTQVTGKDNKVVDPTETYPGAGWVDVIGVDAYFRADYEAYTGLTAAETIQYTWDGPWGIEELYAFAEREGKPFTIAETGITGDATTGDAYSAHINRLAEFVRSRNVMLHGYWNKATPINCQISNGQYVKASAAYKAAFERLYKPWTPALHFGRELVEHRDASIAGSITLDSGSLVNSWNDQVANIPAEATADTRPVYSATARNSKPGITSDGVDDVLVQTNVTNVPVSGAYHTTFMQAYTAWTGTAGNYTYYLSDVDTLGGAVNTRAIGYNDTCVRIQGGGAGAQFQTVQGKDASIITLVHPSFRNASATVQVSVNGSVLAPDSSFLPFSETMVITKRVIFGNGSPGNTTANKIKATLQEVGTITKVLTGDEVNMLSGYLAWKWGTTAQLSDTHPYKIDPPMYGAY